MCYEQGCHPRFIHANTHSVARHAGLRYFKFGIADAVSIADADFVIRKSLHSEVFSELTKGKIVPAQKALPVMIRIHLVDKYGAVLASVAREIGLRITVDIELAHHATPIHWSFPDRRSHRFAVPCHVAGKTDID